MYAPQALRTALQQNNTGIECTGRALVSRRMLARHALRLLSVGQLRSGEIRWFRRWPRTQKSTCQIQGIAPCCDTNPRGFLWVSKGFPRVSMRVPRVSGGFRRHPHCQKTACLGGGNSPFYKIRKEPTARASPFFSGVVAPSPPLPPPGSKILRVHNGVMCASYLVQRCRDHSGERGVRKGGGREQTRRRKIEEKTTRRKYQPAP